MQNPAKTRDEKLTAATSVYHAIKTDIIRGTLSPGHKLRIDQIAARYQVGTNPVREALNRLSSERMVDREDLRGFFVPPISREHFRELVKTRCWLEGKALEESIRNRTVEWEENVILANHRLKRTSLVFADDLPEGSNPPDNSEWEDLHRAFHVTLISNCGSASLLRFCDELMTQIERYRFISMSNSYPRRQSGNEHQGIVDATLDGDIDLAVKRLTDQYKLTLAIFEKVTAIDETD
ncbi:GntR family transcriptional regulator [Amaricoccus tamworthensis]|uniref:GntR family transcriptional regulator n=1 Tax=Amaricoccus tamworthensis TaxID=57002 RepID=UPI003C7AF241